MKIKTALLLFILSSSVFSQKYEYYKNMKNTIGIQDCEGISNKNLNIECLNEKFKETANRYFQKTNPFNFESIKPTRENSFAANAELYYSADGHLTDAKLKDFFGFDSKLIDRYSAKVSKYMVVFLKDFSKQYMKVVPATDFSENKIPVTVPLSVFVIVDGGKIAYSYDRSNHPSSRMDYNDYMNQDELNAYYSLMYKAIEGTFPSEFKKIADQNKVEKCYAHIVFEVDEKGKIKNIRNVQNGNEFLEVYLIEKLNEFKNEFENQAVIAKLLDATPSAKLYFMSFQYGYKK